MSNNRIFLRPPAGWEVHEATQTRPLPGPDLLRIVIVVLILVIKEFKLMQDDINLQGFLVVENGRVW